MAHSDSRAISSWAQLDPRDIPAALLPLAPAFAGGMREDRGDEIGFGPDAEGRRIGALVVLATAATTVTGLVLLMRSLLAVIG